MLRTRLIASAAVLSVAAALGGCATPTAGSANPYAGRHDHQRDAKQGTAPSTSEPSAPFTRKSLRPVS